MRQAGRALPEYRQLREKYNFHQLARTPELAAEVTLQPIRRFGLDAAILFSDILVVPEALGQAYNLRNEGGIDMAFAIQTKTDVERLDVGAIQEKLGYVAHTLRILRTELGDRTALIGFAGSPWTLATYMVEGRSTQHFTRAIALYREDPKTYFALAEKLTAAVTEYLQMQIQCGIDALQIFDTNGVLVPPGQYRDASGRWIQQIISGLTHGATDVISPSTVFASDQPEARPHDAVPVIVFSRGTSHLWQQLIATGANIVSIDPEFPLEKAREVLPRTIAIQGNLKPELLSNATPEAVSTETRRLLTIMQSRNGYIFNLGHGVPPDAKLENIAALVETVQQFNCQMGQRANEQVP